MKALFQRHKTSFIFLLLYYIFLFLLIISISWWRLFPADKPHFQCGPPWEIALLLFVTALYVIVLGIKILIQRIKRKPLTDYFKILGLFLLSLFLIGGLILVMVFFLE